MSIRKKRRELLRLQEAFESEAAQFHELSLSVLYLNQMKAPVNRKFRGPSHIVILWQYYGKVGGIQEAQELFANLENSDLATIGVRGSEFSCYAAIEGTAADRFLRMAKRAGSIFSEKEISAIKAHCIADFKSNELIRESQGPQRKPVFVENESPLAIWLNHVLYHLGITHPRYVPEVCIALDPFAASLSAIDELLESGTIEKATESPKGIEQTKFRVALSFPGERRPYVKEVADSLRSELGDNAVFYDNYYQPDLARPNLDLLLQRIYHEKSNLVVVFLCEDYERKEWCGLEWRAIRDLIKQKQDNKIMLVRFDPFLIPGLFGIDGYIDIGTQSPTELASVILKRLESTSISA
jgi:hypothetical protein